MTQSAEGKKAESANSQPARSKKRGCCFYNHQANLTYAFLKRKKAKMQEKIVDYKAKGDGGALVSFAFHSSHKNVEGAVLDKVRSPFSPPSCAHQGGPPPPPRVLLLTGGRHKLR